MSTHVASQNNKLDESIDQSSEEDKFSSSVSMYSTSRLFQSLFESRGIFYGSILIERVFEPVMQGSLQESLGNEVGLSATDGRLFNEQDDDGWSC